MQLETWLPSTRGALAVVSLMLGQVQGQLEAFLPRPGRKSHLLPRSRTCVEGAKLSGIVSGLRQHTWLITDNMSRCGT